MGSSLLPLSLILFILFACSEASVDTPTSLFDGKSFSGWQGDTMNTWRVEDGMIVGGSLTETVPTNEFLVTDRSYDNFILTAKIKLTGNEGFINSGIQFHSKRLSDPDYEMQGYQADWGEDYWASLYDESRRNRTLIAPDSTQVASWINKNDWNDCELPTHGRSRWVGLRG
uniref:3-keto-disaccharide hydrolase n=1 Tax=Algoriphagus resistens TaxID=1750590 RepID=UPI000716BD92